MPGGGLGLPRNGPFCQGNGLLSGGGLGFPEKNGLLPGNGLLLYEEMDLSCQEMDFDLFDFFDKL